MSASGAVAPVARMRAIELKVVEWCQGVAPALERNLQPGDDLVEVGLGYLDRVAEATGPIDSVPVLRCRLERVGVIDMAPAGRVLEHAQ
jgi:hypothetical protein